METPSSPEVLAAGRYLRLIKRGRWEYADRVNARGAAVIVAVTPDRRLILIEQFRVPLDRRVIELPAGLVGDEQDAEEQFAAAANRELLEETGYEAEQMTEVAHGPPSAGLATELVTLFVAQGLRRVHAGGGTEHENITVHEVPLSEVDNWLKQKMAEGLLIDPKVYAGLYFAGTHFKPPTHPTRGCLLYTDGAPIERAQVEFLNGLYIFEAGGVTGPDGTFVLTTFEENDGAIEGVHTVRAFDATGTRLEIAAGLSNSSASVVVSKGDNEFKLEVARPFNLRVLKP